MPKINPLKRSVSKARENECPINLRTLKTYLILQDYASHVQEHNMNITTMLTVPTEVLQEKENWVHLSDEYSGVAVCIDNTTYEGPVRVGAIEYLFSAALIYSSPDSYSPSCPDTYLRGQFLETPDEEPENKLTEILDKQSDYKLPETPDAQTDYVLPKVPEIYPDTEHGHCRQPRLYLNTYFSWANVIPNQQVR